MVDLNLSLNLLLECQAVIRNYKLSLLNQQMFAFNINRAHEMYIYHLAYKSLLLLQLCNSSCLFILNCSIDIFCDIYSQCCDCLDKMVQIFLSQANLSSQSDKSKYQIFNGDIFSCFCNYLTTSGWNVWIMFVIKHIGFVLNKLLIKPEITQESLTTPDLMWCR